MNHTFKVGDKVHVIEDNDYIITTKGSWGFVTHIVSNRFIEVKFTLCKGNTDYDGYTFAINYKHLELLKPMDIKTAVLNKIKYLEDKAQKIKSAAPKPKRKTETKKK